MAVNSSILSALLRLFFMIAFVSLLFSVTADALELTRNGKSYEFDVELPKGVKLKDKGIDRSIAYKRVDISFRLVQDTYKNCQKLVDERIGRMASRSYFVHMEETVISPKECRVSFFSDIGWSYSTYTFLDICKCYTAMHVFYPPDVDYGVADAIVRTLNTAFATRPAKPQNATVAEIIDPDWKEAFGIFKKRKLSSQLAYNVYSQSTTAALQTGREGKAVVSYLATQFGTSETKVLNDFPGGIDWIFDVETGTKLYGLSPQGIARSISSCYAKGNPGRDCKLNYHQEMGCLMTPKWVALCSSGNLGIYDLCWGEPRGDMPMLPVVKENAERSVELPKANTGGQVKIAKLAKKPTKVAVPFCDDNILRSFYAERGNVGIPPGLLP